LKPKTTKKLQKVGENRQRSSRGKINVADAGGPRGITQENCLTSFAHPGTKLGGDKRKGDADREKTKRGGKRALQSSKK